MDRDLSADHGDIILGHRSSHSSAPHGKERTNELTERTIMKRDARRRPHPVPRDDGGVSPPRRPPPRLIESERGAIVGKPRGDNVPRSLVALRLPSAAASSPSTSHLASTVVFEGGWRTGGVGVSPFPLRLLPLLRSNAMLGMRLQKEGGQKCPVINQKGRKLGGKKGTRGTNWLRVRRREGTGQEGWDGMQFPMGIAACRRRRG